MTSFLHLHKLLISPTLSFSKKGMAFHSFSWLGEDHIFQEGILNPRFIDTECYSHIDSLRDRLIWVWFPYVVVPGYITLGTLHDFLILQFFFLHLCNGITIYSMESRWWRLNEVIYVHCLACSWIYSEHSGNSKSHSIIDATFSKPKMGKFLQETWAGSYCLMTCKWESTLYWLTVFQHYYTWLLYMSYLTEYSLPTSKGWTIATCIL